MASGTPGRPAPVPGQDAQAVDQVTVDHRRRLVDRGEIIGAIPARQKGQVVDQAVLLLGPERQFERRQALGQRSPQVGPVHGSDRSWLSLSVAVASPGTGAGGRSRWWWQAT